MQSHLNEPIFRVKQQNLTYEYVLIDTPNYLCDEDTHTEKAPGGILPKPLTLGTHFLLYTLLSD